MDCCDVKRKIDAYWDRELPPDQSARMRAHLGQCPACHAAYGRLDEWLASPEPLVPAPGLRDRVLAAVFEALDRQGAGSDTARRPAAERGALFTERHTAGSGSRTDGSHPVRDVPRPQPHYRLIPLGWAGALAACITLLLVNQPMKTQVTAPAVAPDPVMIPSLVMVALQPSPLAAAGAAMVQATAIEQVTQSGADVPLRTDRRPLRLDWVPAESEPGLKQLPAVISAVSPLGA